MIAIRSIAVPLLLSLQPLILHGEVPRNTPKDVYQYLSWRSPFTANRHTEAPKILNHAEKLTITGFTQFPDGFFVTLSERDRPDKTHVIAPGVLGDVEIIEVHEHSPNLSITVKYLGTTAKISYDAEAAVKKARAKNTPPAPVSTAPRLVFPNTDPK